MAEHEAPSRGLVSLKNNTYDVIRWFVQYFLPAFGTFYLALSLLWGWPEADKVIGSCTALALFLGALMGLSKKSYENDPNKHDGALVPAFTETGQPIARIDLNPNLTGDDLVAKKSLNIRGLTPAQAELLRSQGLSEPA